MKQIKFLLAVLFAALVIHAVPNADAKPLGREVLPTSITYVWDTVSGQTYDLYVNGELTTIKSFGQTFLPTDVVVMIDRATGLEFHPSLLVYVFSLTSESYTLVVNGVRSPVQGPNPKYEVRANWNDVVKLFNPPGKK
jgi:hypothetical protein